MGEKVVDNNDQIHLTASITESNCKHTVWECKTCVTLGESDIYTALVHVNADEDHAQCARKDVRTSWRSNSLPG